MALLNIRRDPDSGNIVLPTEIAANAFGILQGIGGGLAGIIAGARLANVPNDDIRLSGVLIPVGLSIAGTVAAALFIPGGFG